MSATKSLSLATQRAVIEAALSHTPARMLMRGGSMHPDIREGMVLHLAPAVDWPAVGSIVVFHSGSRLVAHRVVARRAAQIVCAGDAQPDCVELVQPQDVVARVAAVYDAAGHRVDTRWRAFLGALRARFRAPRALALRLQPKSRPRPYAALIKVFAAAACGDGAAIEAIAGHAAPWRLAELALRHRCAAALYAALREADGANTAALKNLLRREHWRAAARAPHFRAQVIAIAQALENAGVPALLLKGAQRAVLHESAAALYSSQDIDVLVGGADIPAAQQALIAQGYFARPFRGMLDYDRHHHAAPLYVHGGHPVELHRALCMRDLHIDTTWDALREHMLRVYSPEAGTVNVLDPVGTAWHLAIHCLERPALREVLLLADRLAGLEPRQLRQFKALLAREARFAVPLSAAAAFAAQIAGLSWDCGDRAREYLRWMQLREDLPLPLRARTECADAWMAFPEQRVRAALGAALGNDPVPLLKRAARALARILCGAAGGVYGMLMIRADRAPRTARARR